MNRRRRRRWNVLLLLAAMAAPAASQAVNAPRNLLGIADSSGCTNDPAASTTVPGWITTAGSPALLCAALPGSGAPPHAGRITSGPYGSST
ncbi:MAG TPA: hypothetical protein VMU86_02650, partial [Steroidobacteraceae bacterium]|nr:hypothetical protein [Steroidobacteraceae bacterium]